ncbi:MAG: hypothetical protein V1670_02970 [Candidatus Omnitrophota bacterium]
MNGLKEKKSTSVALVILFCLIVFAVPGKSFGLGLGVDPGEINLQNVPLGQKAAVSVLGGELMKLRVKNKGASACTYIINILYSAQTSAALSAGYKDIPDTSWIYPESKEVVVPGNSVKDVELYIKIPKQKKYSNKRYQAVIEVKSKKNSPQELFVVACQLKMCFSTGSQKSEVRRLKSEDRRLKSEDRRLKTED